MSLYFIVSLVVEALLYMFHLSIFILVFAKQKSVFHGPFYCIFRIVIVADLLSYVAVTLCQKLVLISVVMYFLKNSGMLASFLYGFISGITVMQFIGHLLMAFNRFTLIWFPLKHKSIWTRQWYTVLLILLPFFHVVWKLHEPVAFIFGADNSVSIAFVNRQITVIDYYLSTTIFLTTTFLAAISNILAFIKFYFYKLANNSVNINERNLLYISFITFGAQLIRISFNICRLLFSSDLHLMSFFYTILPVLNDIFALSGTISLLILSVSTRKEYLSFYFCKNYGHSISTSNPKLFQTSVI